MQTATILTRREHEVMLWLAKGCRNKEIGLRLGISENTVERHLKNIYTKLKARNRVEALASIHRESRESVIA